MSGNANAVLTILAHAARLGERVALVHYDEHYARTEVSYADFAALVSRVAGACAARGLHPGDRVCLLMNDSPAYCASFLGIVMAGGVAIALNTRLAPAEYAFALADSGARWIVADHSLAALLPADDPRIVASDALMAQAQSALPMDAPMHRAGSDPSFWFYSSGTTGRPKAIIHDHATLAAAGKLHREVTGADERTTILSTSKLFFAFALDNNFLGALSVGATAVINTNWPEPGRVLEQVERHRPAIFFSVPSFFRRMLQSPPATLAPFRHVRVCYTGGERVPESVIAQWKSATGAPLLTCYGMSETFLNALAERAERPRPGSCGAPLAEVETRLLDREGNEVARGEPGTLWLRFPYLTRGYLHEAANARAFRDGWFCTNDLFVVDADGFWWHQGRSDELLKVAGLWVKPAEVEEAALASGALRDAACVVVPDADGFERLALFVVPNTASTDATRAASESLRERLPRHSQPKWVREIAELPRTPTGKVQRFKLRELFLAEPMR